MSNPRFIIPPSIHTQGVRLPTSKSPTPNPTVEPLADPVLIVGTLIDERYEIVKPLDAGAMGLVYVVKDTTSGNFLALKTIKPNIPLTEETIKRFDREAFAMQKVDHPNVIKFFGYGHLERDDGGVDGRPYLLMEYLDGKSLKQEVGPELLFSCAVSGLTDLVKYLRSDLSAEPSDSLVVLIKTLKDGKSVNLTFNSNIYSVERDGDRLSLYLETVRKPWRYVVSLALQLCDGLSAMHDHGMTHRDIKPGNIFISSEGDGIAKLLDLGLVDLNESTDAGSDATKLEELTREGIVAGTYKYLAPEIFNGSPSNVRSDLYSLGATLYRTLSGKPPITGSDVQIFRDQVKGTVSIPDFDFECESAETNSELKRILFKLLARNPDDRYESAASLKMDLLSLLGESPRLSIAPDESSVSSAAYLTDDVVSDLSALKQPSNPPAPITASTDVPFELVAARQKTTPTPSAHSSQSKPQGAGSLVVGSSIVTQPPPKKQSHTLGPVLLGSAFVAAGAMAMGVYVLLDSNQSQENHNPAITTPVHRSASPVVQSYETTFTTSSQSITISISSPQTDGGLLERGVVTSNNPFTYHFTHPETVILQTTVPGYLVNDRPVLRVELDSNTQFTQPLTVTRVAPRAPPSKLPARSPFPALAPLHDGAPVAPTRPAQPASPDDEPIDLNTVQ